MDYMYSLQHFHRNQYSQQLDFGILFSAINVLSSGFVVVLNLNNPDGLRLDALPLPFTLAVLEMITPDTHFDKLSLTPRWEQQQAQAILSRAKPP
jgi:hypothetical protein